MPRVFIAINLPKKTIGKLADKQKEISLDFDSDPVKWVSSDNLHITLAFLGQIKKTELKSVEREVEKINFNSFRVNTDEIKYIPNRREAKMIWAIVEDNKKLQELKKRVEDALKGSDTNYSPDLKEFKPHITLGRIRTFEFKKISLEEIPLLEDQFIEDNFEIESFEIMESRLKKGGPEYKIIKSIKSNK